ncbi:MAG: 30S ribosomal protein S16 [Candidatus Doudnabacteria bacterium]|nr:30S ribosomal protein S16 [Candidatus Doudnabacteria bacterium]
MLTIRLQRTGTKNRPAFRIVLAQAQRAASKKFLEVLGHYNPRNKELGIRNKERLEYWLSKHIQLSPTVHNLFVDKQFIPDKKIKAWRPKKKQVAVPAEIAPAPAAETKVDT